MPKQKGEKIEPKGIRAIAMHVFAFLSPEPVNNLVCGNVSVWGFCLISAWQMALERLGRFYLLFQGREKKDNGDLTEAVVRSVKLQHTSWEQGSFFTCA